MEQDLHSQVKVVTGLAPVAITTGNDTAVVDTLGYESFEWLVALGVLAGTFSFVFEESDVVTFGGEETVVPAANVIGVSPTYIATDDGQARRVGIIGKKRFQRCSIAGAATPSAIASILALLSHPVIKPEPDQSTAE